METKSVVPVVSEVVIDGMVAAFETVLLKAQTMQDAIFYLYIFNPVQGEFYATLLPAVLHPGGGKDAIDEHYKTALDMACNRAREEVYMFCTKATDPSDSTPVKFDSVEQIYKHKFKEDEGFVELPIRYKTETIIMQDMYFADRQYVPSSWKNKLANIGRSAGSIASSATKKIYDLVPDTTTVGNKLYDLSASGTAKAAAGLAVAGGLAAVGGGYAYNKLGKPMLSYSLQKSKDNAIGAVNFFYSSKQLTGATLSKMLKDYREHLGILTADQVAATHQDCAAKLKDVQTKHKSENLQSATALACVYNIVIDCKFFASIKSRVKHKMDLQPSIDNLEICVTILQDVVKKIESKSAKKQKHIDDDNLKLASNTFILLFQSLVEVGDDEKARSLQRKLLEVDVYLQRERKIANSSEPIDYALRQEVDDKRYKVEGFYHGDSSELYFLKVFPNVELYKCNRTEWTKDFSASVSINQLKMLTDGKGDVGELPNSQDTIRVKNPLKVHLNDTPEIEFQGKRLQPLSLTEMISSIINAEDSVMHIQKHRINTKIASICSDDEFLAWLGENTPLGLKGKIPEFVQQRLQNFKVKKQSVPCDYLTLSILKDISSDEELQDTSWCFTSQGLYEDQALDAKIKIVQKFISDPLRRECLEGLVKQRAHGERKRIYASNYIKYLSYPSLTKHQYAKAIDQLLNCIRIEAKRKFRLRAMAGQKQSSFGATTRAARAASGEPTVGPLVSDRAIKKEIQAASKSSSVKDKKASTKAAKGASKAAAKKEEERKAVAQAAKSKQEAEKAKKEAAKKEAAKKEAAVAKKEAEKAKKEAERKVAEAQKKEAENAKKEAEKAKKEAEAQKKEAEKAKKEAEAKKAEAIKARTQKSDKAKKQANGKGADKAKTVKREHDGDVKEKHGAKKGQRDLGTLPAGVDDISVSGDGKPPAVHGGDATTGDPPAADTPAVDDGDDAPAADTPEVDDGDDAPAADTPAVDDGDDAPAADTPVVDGVDDTDSDGPAGGSSQTHGALLSQPQCIMKELLQEKVNICQLLYLPPDCEHWRQCQILKAIPLDWASEIDSKCAHTDFDVDMTQWRNEVVQSVIEKMNAEMGEGWGIEDIFPNEGPDLYPDAKAWAEHLIQNSAGCKSDGSSVECALHSLLDSLMLNATDLNDFNSGPRLLNHIANKILSKDLK